MGSSILLKRFRACVWEPAIVRLRLRRPLLIAATFVTLLAWPLGTQRIRTGVDASYRAALHMVVHEHLTFGRDVAFTYGPLGFVTSPDLYFATTGLIAIAVNIAVAAVLTYLVLRLLNTAAPLWVCVVIAAPVLMILNPLLLGSTPLLPYTGFVVAATWALRRLLNRDRPWQPVDVIVPTLLATAVMLMKLDAGIECLVVIAYAVFFCGLQMSGIKVALLRMLVFFSTLVVSVPALWVIIGQPITALPLWLSRSRDIARGFAAAMSAEVSGSWEYATALLVVVVIGVLTAMTWQLGRQHRLAVLGYLALVSFLAFKEGFVRHDTHSIEFFTLFVILPLALLPRWPLRQVLVAVAIPGVAVFAIANVNLIDALSPKPRIESIAEVAKLTVSSSKRRDVIDSNRERLRQEYAIPGEIVARIKGHTVDIEPDEIGVAWAYYPDIHWRQEPILQEYTAYTTRLDHAAATFFAGHSRPTYVLRKSSQPGPSIEDNRVPRFDPPEANLALLCHYRVVYQDPTWQLLESASNRCGTPRELTHRTVGFAQRVALPAMQENRIVVGRFHGIADSFVDTIQDLAYKPPEIYIRLNGNPQPFRFLQGHQGSPHVLVVPDCALEQVDGAPASPLHNIELKPRSRERDRHYDLELFSVPFRC